MKRALRKKMHKTFKVGDVITWGNGDISHRIIEVCEHGVIVDSTSSNYGLPKDKILTLYVTFDKNNKNVSGRGPIRHSDDEPDKWKVHRPYGDSVTW